MEKRTFSGHRTPIVALLLLTSAAALAEPAADTRIGSIKTAKPEAVVLHQGSEQPAQVGGLIYRGDTLLTRSNGAVGVTFMDGAVLSLGPDSRFTVDDFLFKPAEREVTFLSTLMKGTATFISGAIGRISPESVKFKTPTATLGLRGTKILVEVK
jgi:hypothetical protein